MELLLLLVLLMQGSRASQNNLPAQASLDVEVLRFSWSHDRRGGLIASEETEPAYPNIQPRVFQQSQQRQVENINAVENRIQNMRNLEDRVTRERTDSLARDSYSYRVELRNRGTKVIKWVFWDYQTSEPSDPDNISHRQFACAVKIKPNDGEELRAFSALPPRMVISANKEMKRLTEKLIINRVEYADGAIWQRPDWHSPEYISSRSSGRGKCRPI